jgi:hypothetical protein
VLELVELLGLIELLELAGLLELGALAGFAVSLGLVELLVVPEVLDGFELVDVLDAFTPVVNIATVCGSSLPEACSPCCCWNCLMAAFVFGPILPSTAPTLRPFSFSACWISETCELSPCEDALAMDADGEL